MPRKKIDIPLTVEWLSVLSEDGTLDTSVEPKIPDADLRKLYKTMLLTRRLDERCLGMQRQGRIGTYGPCTGQEATALGMAYCLRKEDWLAPTYRELAAYLYRGWPVGTYLLWWGGHEAGSVVPAGVNDLPICVPIGSQCQYGMGIAWGCKLRKDSTVCAAFIGDGGTSQGDFHEALNFATVFQVPLVLMIQNNHWAISVPREKQAACQTLAQRAISYGMNALQIDGNDILAVIAACREAIEKARTGGGPQLIEAITYRLKMHTTADDPKKYRSEDVVKQWEKRDPLPRFRRYLYDKQLLDEKIEAVMEEEVKKLIDEGVAVYENHRHDKFEFLHHMYAEQTPDLARQEAELRDYLENGKPAPLPASEPPIGSPVAH